MTDLPENVDLNWIGKTLLAMQEDMRKVLRELQSLRDEAAVTGAILNRIDHNQSNFVEELRAMRIQQERVRKRVESLEKEDTPQ